MPGCRCRALLAGVFSTGAASEFAGVPTPVFLGGMAEFGILAFDPTPEEFEKEVETVLQHSRKVQDTKR